MTVPVNSIPRYSPERVKKELHRTQALADYSQKLADWEGVEQAFTVAVETVAGNVSELAALAATVDAKRLALIGDYERLRAQGVHPAPPKVRRHHSLAVLQGARTSRRAAISAISQAAKEKS